jgi:hypothetical protein
MAHLHIVRLRQTGTGRSSIIGQRTDGSLIVFPTESPVALTDKGMDDLRRGMRRCDELGDSLDLRWGIDGEMMTLDPVDL